MQSSYKFSDTLFMFSLIVFVFSLILFVFSQILYVFSQLFSEAATGERDPTQVFSYEYCEIFNNIYFEEHLRTAGVLKQHVISKFFWFPNIRGHSHIQVATQNVNLTLYFLPTHAPLITSSVAIEKYLPNKPLNVTNEDTPGMSPHPMSIKNY